MLMLLAQESHLENLSYKQLSKLEVLKTYALNTFGLKIYLIHKETARVWI